MSAETDDYKASVEKQKDELLDYLSRMGFATTYDLDIPEPDEESPLAEVILATRLAADNLALVARQRDDNLRQLQEKIKTVELQTRAILELSTPVIRVWEQILVLPLIGTIDTIRARQIMDDLLEAVARQEAAVVIVDITGVPVVDTKVAGHLIRTVQATRLLGAEAILTGVSPHNAQTLVKLGVELHDVTTRSSLESGLRVAFEITRQKVTRVD